MNQTTKYYPDGLDPFPRDLADSLLEQALQSLGFTKDRLSNLTTEAKLRLDNAVWRLVTAADVSDQPCHD